MGRKEGHQGRSGCRCWSRTLAWDFVLPFGIVVFLTLYLALGDRELEWHKSLYDFENQAWTAGDSLFWIFLYHLTIAPALMITVVAVWVLAAGFWHPYFKSYRRISLYLILLLVIAPGIIVNLVLKEHWGRPRPRAVEEFGGPHAYESVLAPDPESDGHSFPSGHATVAFYIMAGWFLLRRRQRTAAVFFLVSGILFGGLVGYMRMLQGGHFATDVIWAWAVCYFTAAALYHIMDLEKYPPIGGRKSTA